MTHDLVERFAIRCARGNNGGEWAAHYTEEQKEFWRGMVRELVLEVIERDAAIVSRHIGEGSRCVKAIRAQTEAKP